MFKSKKAAPVVAAPTPTPPPAPTKSDQKVRTTIDTLLGKGTTIDGDVRFSGGLHIEGVVKGNLVADDAEAMLVLSEHGHIQGEVRVSNIVVNGTIDGDVYATSKIELYERAQVCGDVYYHLLEMAVGSEVNGKLVRQKNEAANAPAKVERAEVVD